MATVVFAQNSFNSALFLGYAIVLEVVLTLSSQIPNSFLYGSLHLFFIVLFSSISHFILTPLLFVSSDSLSKGENLLRGNLVFKFFSKKFDIYYVRKINNIIYEFNNKGDFKLFFKKFLKVILQLSQAQRVSLAVFSPDFKRAKLISYLPLEDRDIETPEIYLSLEEIAPLFNNFKTPSSQRVDFHSKITELLPRELHIGKERFISTFPAEFRGGLIGILFIFSRREPTHTALTFIREYFKLANAIIYSAYLEFKYSNYRNIDSTTGLLNFSASTRALNKLVEKAKEDSQRFSLLMIELENLRELNRYYGAKRGDLIMELLAQQLKREAGDGGFAGRFGEKRFLLALYQKGSNEARDIALNFIKEFESKTEQICKNPEPKVAVAIAEYPHHTKEKRALLDLLEKTLYRIKTKGMDNILIASAIQNTPLPENISFHSLPPSGWSWSSSPPLNELLSKVRTKRPESKR